MDATGISNPHRNPNPAPSGPASAISPEELLAWMDRRDRFRRRLLIAGLAFAAVAVLAAGFLWRLFHANLMAASELRRMNLTVDWDLNRANLAQGGQTSVSYSPSWRNASAWPGPGDLDPILRLRHVVSLSLSRYPIGDQHLGFLDRLDELTTLDLDQDSTENTPVFGQVPNRNSITDVTLERVGKLPRLETLNIGGTKVSDEGLAYLSGLKTLKTLDLSETAVSDAGMAALANLTGLESLFLRGTDVTDAGLARLGKLKRLKYLVVLETKMTREGVARFQGVHPGVEVILEEIPVGDSNR